MKSEPLCRESCNNISTILYVAGVAIIMGLCLMCCSCNVSKRLARIDANHPLETATFCAERFPAVERTEVRIDTVTQISYMPPEVHYVDCDSALKYRTDTGRLIVQVPCPPAQLITKLVTKDSIVRVENRAAIESARLTADKWRSKYDAARLWRNRLGWAAGIGWLLIIGTIAIRFLRPKWL